MLVLLEGYYVNTVEGEEIPPGQPGYTGLCPPLMTPRESYETTQCTGYPTNMQATLAYLVNDSGVFGTTELGTYGIQDEEGNL